MRKLVSILAITIMMISCGKEGEIAESPPTVYNIQGKYYKFVKVIPRENHQGCWILIPLDSLTSTPKVIHLPMDENRSESIIQIN